MENRSLINGQVDNQIRCQMCQWNENCIQPPRMTKEEVERQIKGDIDKREEDKEGGLFSGMLSAMVYGGEASRCPVCEVFAERLRSSPKLANIVKDIMKNWEESNEG